VGISNENATNRLGIYDLDIKDHTITFSNESFSSSILPAGQIDATGKSVFIAVDQNNRAISNDQIYNGIVEKLAHLLEMEKQPKLQIYNQVDSKK
jgi:hypothetical protein